MKKLVLVALMVVAGLSRAGVAGAADTYPYSTGSPCNLDMYFTSQNVYLATTPQGVLDPANIIVNIPAINTVPGGTATIAPLPEGSTPLKWSTPCPAGLKPGTYYFQSESLPAFAGGQSSRSNMLTITILPPPNSVSIAISGTPGGANLYSVEAVVGAGMPTTGVRYKFYVDGVLYRDEGMPKFCMFGGDVVCNKGKIGTPGAHVVRLDAVNTVGAVLATDSTTITE